jgi:hypothetical protein
MYPSYLILFPCIIVGVRPSQHWVILSQQQNGLSEL